jgi:hypothetical protein
MFKFLVDEERLFLKSDPSSAESLVKDDLPE